MLLNYYFCIQFYSYRGKALRGSLNKCLWLLNPWFLSEISLFYLYSLNGLFNWIQSFRITVSQKWRWNGDSGRQNIAPPKDVHIIILRTCKYITLHDKGKCADVVLFRIFKGRNCSWIIWVVSNIITKVLIKRKQESQSQSRRCDDGSRNQREWKRES